MKKFSGTGLVLQQGETVLFSDFEDDGPMWSGEGDRSARVQILFPNPFREAPAIHASIKMIDAAHWANQRYDLVVEAVDGFGFTLVFKTWGDSKIARASAAWTAFGEEEIGDDWSDE